MNSKDYWALRSAQDMVDRMGTAEQTAAEMNKAIQQSADYIAKEVKAVFRGIESFGISEAEARKILNAAGNKTALQSLRAAANRVSDPDKRQALMSAIDSAGAYRYRITRLEQLNKDINAECRKLYKTENRAVTSALKTVANDSYYHSIFNIQQETGLGFSFAKFSQKDVDRILRGNWLGGNYSQRIWKDVSATAESMKKELLVSMLSGRSNEKTARIIQERFGVNAYCARRIVRTESAYVANAAQMSAYDEAGVEKYRFIATLDSKTSEVCAALDGKVFAAKDAKPGTNYPPMHPFCRSTTIAEFGEDTLAGMERRARDEDGNVVKVPADMGYEEWYRRFVENGVDKSVESGIMNTRGTVVVDGKNVVGEWKPRPGFDNEIDDIIEYQGFNGNPTIVYDREEFDKCVERDHFLAERTFCADSEEDLIRFDNQLKAINGEDYFYVNCGVGGSQYGKGMYCAADYTKGAISYDKFEHEIKQYAWGDSHKFNKTNWMTLDPSAKILEIPTGYDRNSCREYVVRQYKSEYERFRLSQDPVLKEHWEKYQSGMDEVRQLYSDWNNNEAWAKADKIVEKLDAQFPDAFQLNQDIMNSAGNKDAGTLAAEMGYDAINAQGHGTTDSYTVVLNRTKLIIYGGNDYEYHPKI